MKSKILLLSLCLAVCLLPILSGCRQRTGSEETDETRRTVPEELPQIARTADESDPEPQSAVLTCVLIGDSLTARGDFSQYFDSAVIRNLGINGDTIAGVTERLDQAREASPDLLFILCGINSLSDRTKKSCLEAYGALLDGVDAIKGNARIVVESVLPISREWQEWKICSDETIREFNEGIRASAEAHGFGYLDLYEKFVVDGAMNAELTTDGLHLNESGYDIWAAEIGPFLEDTDPFRP